MGGKYSVHDIDKALVRKWMDGELTPDLHVPQANKYLAESLELKSSEKSLGTHIREWIKSQKSIYLRLVKEALFRVNNLD